ncbi:MAG: periplasmic heavy metal sensor [Paracoccaceae bacterium]
MTNDISLPRKTAPRWMKITLVLSLAANLAVVGLVAGFALHGPIWRPDRDGMAALMRGLPPEHMRALRSELRGHGDRLREGLRGQRELATALASALRAEPFSPEAFADLLASQRGRVAALQTIGHDALVARVTMMSADERAAYARMLENRQRRGNDDD